ncbi:MAG: urease accessory protein UreD [Actinomycetes bacterium]
MLRPTSIGGPVPLRRWKLTEASPVRVALVGGAAGPLGGDDLRLHVDVGAGASLVLKGVAATLVLPGPHGQASSSEVSLRVGAGATLVWLPGPVIAAAACSHRAVTRIELAPGARLLAREQLVLGRHGERPGALRQRLRVTIGARPLHDQELRVGPESPGWDGAAVTGGRRALGSVVVVDPAWADSDGPALPAVASSADVARLPLDGPAVLVTALAPDMVTLRERLETAVAGL